MLSPETQAIADLLKAILKPAISEVVLEAVDIGTTLKDLPPVMSQATVARALDKHPSTICSWIKSGHIKTVFVHDIAHIEKTELLRFIVDRNIGKGAARKKLSA